MHDSDDNNELTKRKKTFISGCPFTCFKRNYEEGLATVNYLFDNSSKVKFDFISKNTSEFILLEINCLAFCLVINK